MISPYKIKWQNLSSLDFDLWVELSFDEDSGSTSTFLNRENITTEHYNGRRTIHRSKYQEVLTPTITLIKQDYEDFTPGENRKILSWLTSNEKPGYLEIFHDDSEAISYKLLGNWTEVEQYKLGNSRVVGYVATFESSAPYAYSRKLTYPEVYESVVEIGNNDETNDYLHVVKSASFDIECNSDEYNKLLYPKVTVKLGDNMFFPITEKPTDSYQMIPRVIYSYTYEEYSTDDMDKIKSAFEGLSDEEKADLGIGARFFDELKSEEVDMVAKSQNISKQTKEELYININTSKVQINNEPISTDTPAKEKSGYYYCPNDKVVKKVVETINDNDNKTYAWETVSTYTSMVQIENKTTSTKTIIAGNAQDEIIVFDGANKVIASDRGTMARIIGDDFNWEWPAFTMGTNSFEVIGNCDIKLEWVEPRKVGSL